MYKVLILSILFFLVTCKSSDSRTSEEIAALEAKLAQEPSQQTLQQLLDLYQEMVSKTKGDESLEYLWKSGETARAVQNFPVAEKIFQDIYENHPTSELASKAMFLHAFMCDEDLKQYDKAKAIYQSFIAKYPESDFFDDAQFLLENLGKSDEEMLELLSKPKE